ncbi:sodium/solute symporter [Homoserinibacter sp. YIM 151385]|uniref:sodium/solute symporter n=1 Tax=Homoserinibacter sp. YIM 151385 TaxID=2985506 RepID=UPI0022F13AE9|nr:cation acetate symporter [Homoserinibacter sp. YIM 151385]WBU38510.1 cation acetate symporter [Homoserinibacter sp. YIM 151385]
MSAGLSLGAIGLVVLATVVVGVHGLRISRTTDDFLVASRTVRTWWNASAISGEYLSAATFLGLTGLVLLDGTDAFWFPIGYCGGYLLLLVFVAAPLRRSGARTIPAFLAARLDSPAARRVTTLLVVVIGWLYIVPQLHGAAITVNVVTGLPPWLGAAGVALVVGVIVAAGGMRSITFVQAFHYWLKLTAMGVPVVLLLIAAGGHESAGAGAELFPVNAGPSGQDPLRTASLMLALLLGTMGLPHVLVRFYTNPDGGSARRTTLVVIALISVFYMLSSTMGLLARMVAPDLAEPGVADSALLLLPARLLPGPAGEVVTAIIIAGAFAAFISTSSGLVVSLAGSVSEDLLGGGVRAFRIAALGCAIVPVGFALVSVPGGLTSSVGLVFLVAASSMSPVLLLGVWWRRLTARGAIAAMLVGAASSIGAVALDASGLLGDLVLLEQPALWTVPLATAVAVIVSRLDQRGPPSGAHRRLLRLHAPERRLTADEQPTP